MALPHIDTFTGADYTPLHTYNAGWVYYRQDAELTIYNNALKCNSSNGTEVGWEGDGDFSNDQYAQIKAVYLVTQGYVGLMVRGSGDGTASGGTSYYAQMSSDDGFYLYYHIHGVIGETELASTTATKLAVGDVVRLEAVGNQITLYLNGSVILGPVTDNHIASGHAGVDPWGNTGTLSDNFECGNIVFPTTGILDDFNRTSVSPLDGNWTNGYYDDDPLSLVSNTKVAYTGIHSYGGARYNAATYGPDCEVYVTIPTLDSGGVGVYLSLRVGGTLSLPNSYWLKYADGTNACEIDCATNGSDNKISSGFTMPIVAGDKIGFRAVGTTLTAYYYHSGIWTVAYSMVDSTYQGAGYLALEIQNTTFRCDDFGGGTILNYTRGDYATLPSDDTDLETTYSNQDLIDVSTINSVYVGQTHTTGYAIHEFKNDVGGASSCTLEWVGQSTLAPSSHTVYLQIYNHVTTTWDAVDSNSSSNANTDFTLSGSVSALTNYKDAGNVISCRVYQIGT
jgi:hypothetical protein